MFKPRYIKKRQYLRIKSLLIPLSKKKYTGDLVINMKLIPQGFQILLQYIKGNLKIRNISSSIDKKNLTIFKNLKHVNGDFYCSFNGLTSLQGCPQKVEGSLNVDFNILKSLQGGPKYVGELYNCAYNNLTSLYGSPQIIYDNFDCSFNKLTSLQGGPKQVNVNYECQQQINGHMFTVEYVENICNVVGKIYV